MDQRAESRCCGATTQLCRHVWDHGPLVGCPISYRIEPELVSAPHDHARKETGMVILQRPVSPATNSRNPKAGYLRGPHSCREVQGASCKLRVLG
jgi:hypothetical protein